MFDVACWRIRIRTWRRLGSGLALGGAGSIDVRTPMLARSASTVKGFRLSPPAGRKGAVRSVDHGVDPGGGEARCHLVASKGVIGRVMSMWGKQKANTTRRRAPCPGVWSCDCTAPSCAPPMARYRDHAVMCMRYWVCKAAVAGQNGHRQHGAEGLPMRASTVRARVCVGSAPTPAALP